MAATKGRFLISSSIRKIGLIDTNVYFLEDKMLQSWLGVKAGFEGSSVRDFAAHL